MKKEWLKPILFYLCNVLFLMLLGLIYCLIYDYEIATYFSGYIDAVFIVATIILLLSVCIGLILTWGLRDGKSIRRIIKLQVTFSVLFFSFWVYNLFQNHKEEILKEQTNECLENNMLMVTLAFYNGEKVDSVYDVMKNIANRNPIVDSTLVAIIETSQLLDKRIKSNAITDIDTIYCINKGYIITERLIKNNFAYNRAVIFEYELTRKNTYYRAKYLWNSDQCILDTLFQLH